MISVLLACSLASANQRGSGHDEEYCNNLKVAGTGYFEVGSSVNDKKLALEYQSWMTGDGDLEMDNGQAMGTTASQVQGKINGSDVPLNLFETSKIAYKGKTPMTGFKYIRSREFYGGIGAEILETFSVTEMEKEQTTFFASANPIAGIKDRLMRDKLMKAGTMNSVGTETKTSFNGTWTTDARMHKMFSKDVKIHESFAGRFEVQKMLKFHENPVPEVRSRPCDGIDC